MAAGEVHIQLYTKWDLDDKVLGLTDSQQLLYIKLLCLAKELLSDGYISDAQLVAVRMRRVPHQVLALTSRGLLDRVPGGYQIVSYLKRNKSRAEIQEKAAQYKVAGQKANHDRWHKDKRKAGCTFCSSDTGSDSDKKPESDSSDHLSNIDIDIDIDNPSDKNTDQLLKRWRSIVPKTSLAESAIALTQCRKVVDDPFVDEVLGTLIQQGTDIGSNKYILTAVKNAARNQGITDEYWDDRTKQQKAAV